MPVRLYTAGGNTTYALFVALLVAPLGLKAAAVEYAATRLAPLVADDEVTVTITYELADIGRPPAGPADSPPSQRGSDGSGRPASPNRGSAHR